MVISTIGQIAAGNLRLQAPAIEGSQCVHGKQIRQRPDIRYAVCISNQRFVVFTQGVSTGTILPSAV